MKIITVGASGLLGSMLVPVLKLAGHDIVTVGRSSSNDFKCDVGDQTSVRSVLNELRPDILINLVALTDVDLCESDPRQAFKVNVRALENIVSWIENTSKNCHLIHLSTDQVYDGVGPHYETDVMLSNYYAFSKYASELVALRVASTILRTNFIGKSKCDKRVSFTDWIYKAIVNDEKIFLFSDVFFSPLAMQTLAEMICKVIELKPRGVFNLGSRSGLSKSGFGLLFAEKLKLATNCIKVSSIDDVTFMKTYRPKDMCMDVTKFEQRFGIKLPTLENEINIVTGDYDAKAGSNI
jgi:dTDP-4-dehydrorhamnose reductase